MRLRAVWLLLLLSAWAGAEEPLEKVLSRLAEEAAVFLEVAPRTVSEETFQQRLDVRPSLLRPRREPVSGVRPRGGFRTRTIVSEYGYSTFAESPNVLHEFRQVISVDGKEVRSRARARLSLSLGVNSRDDRTKRKMLRELEQYGLTSAVVDLGQVILLFGGRRLADYQFQFSRHERVGAERASVYAFRQVGGAGSVTVFQGRTAHREALQGEVWVRESDLLPLRVVLRTGWEDERHIVWSEAAVDYSMSVHGVLLPASVVHREYVDETLQVENLFRYTPFRRFTAEAEIKFGEPPAEVSPRE